MRSPVPGKRFLPGDVRLRLDLLDEHRFGNGVVHLHYRLRASVEPGPCTTLFRPVNCLRSSTDHGRCASEWR